MKLSLLILLLPLCACTTTTYTDSSGAKFSRTSFLTKQSLGKLDVKAGDKSLSLDSYANDQTETAAAVAGAVARALAKP